METILGIISILIASFAAFLSLQANRASKRAVSIAEKANELTTQSNVISERGLLNAITDRDYKLTPQIEVKYHSSEPKSERWKFANVSGSKLFNIKCEEYTLFCKLQPLSRAKQFSVSHFYVPKEMEAGATFTLESDLDEFKAEDLKLHLGNEYDMANSATYLGLFFDCRRETDKQRFVWSQAFLIYPNGSVKSAPKLETDISIIDNTPDDPWTDLVVSFFQGKLFEQKQ